MIVGSIEFWNAYDAFFNEAHLKEFTEGSRSPLVSDLCTALATAHYTGELHKLIRPDRGWHIINAWVALRGEYLRDEVGHPVITVRQGDVIVVQHQWDRDVFITHCPATECICGAIFGGMRRWPESFGTFMPLFSQASILACIQLRLTKNHNEGMDAAFKEATAWNWP